MAMVLGYMSTISMCKTASDYNTYNLRSDAKFEVKIDKDVYWVPANTLGASRYTNAQIAQIALLSPEEKQKKISTLYEALQLYQISNFKASRDNVRIMENGINWEHHKPGYQAVRTNEGCCATDSSWLNYILKNDYDELGFVSYSFQNGNGHVFNYIKESEYYYVIDLTRYTNELGPALTIETGIPSDFNFFGCVIKVKSLPIYALQNFMRQGSPPGLYTGYAADLVVPIDSIFTNADMVITLPSDKKVKILFDNKYDNMSLSYANPPIQKVDWDSIPDAEINPVIPDLYNGEQITDQETGHKYKIVSMVKTWDEAQTYCESIGGYLVTEESESEHKFVMKNLVSRNAFNGTYWIGGFEDGSIGDWQWVTGEVFNFKNWKAGDPGNTVSSQKSCLVMGRSGLWYSRPASKKDSHNYFICEWNN